MKKALLDKFSTFNLLTYWKLSMLPLLYTDCDILNLLLANEKVDINETEHGWTALHLAIYNSNVTAARFLLSNGADPNFANTGGWTPLHLAAIYAKDMDIVKLLVNHKDVDVNRLDNEGRTALHNVIINKHGLGEAIANLLKEKGAVKRENLLPEGNNESLKKLMRTFGNQKADEIENLLSDNTKTMEEKISKFSEEYLISIIIDSDVETLCRLLKNGADISACCGEMGENALQLASFHAETTDVIDIILETEKFDINGVDNDGDTPLHYAIMGYNSAKNAPHLIQLGADPNIANKTKVTPLHLATKNAKTTDVIDAILETGQCNINGVDDDGRTPLRYAIERPDPVNTINARRLIKMGADPGIADKNGVTPLHMAARNAESMDLIELLLNTEAVDVNCVDIKGRTPLDCALDNKHGLGQIIIDRLKEYCAKE
jgi:ankyrin repeat protein